MKSYKFRTNINCNGCIKSVTPYLDQLKPAEWQVDIQDKRKVLEVKSDQITEAEIIKKVREAGYEIQPLKEGIWNKLFS
ncbi:MAG: heavy-metal-associated domain-containing protein [Cyclobacteriaceae bacterium]|nr:heavy-metal-associated domain-containing protein [Cyclobacteriaceae bacterium]